MLVCEAEVYIGFYVGGHDLFRLVNKVKQAKSNMDSPNLRYSNLNRHTFRNPKITRCLERSFHLINPAADWVAGPMGRPMQLREKRKERK